MRQGRIVSVPELFPGDVEEVEAPFADGTDAVVVHADRRREVGVAREQPAAVDAVEQIVGELQQAARQGYAAPQGGYAPGQANGAPQGGYAQQPRQMNAAPQGGYAQPAGQNAAPQGSAAAPAESWTCECGNVNHGKFCSECGKPRPAGPWTCSCGTVNTGKFCSECGKPRS